MTNNTKYDEIKILFNGVLAIRIGYKWGLVSNNYKPLSKIIYDYITVEGEIITLLYDGYKFCVHITDLPLKYDCIYNYNKLSNNKLWAICKINNQVGVIDTDGAILVPCKFKTIKDFNGAFWVSLLKEDGEFWGIYSYNGEKISDCVYNYTNNIIVKKKYNDKFLFGILDNHSNEIIKCEYDSIKSIYAYRYGHSHLMNKLIDKQINKDKDNALFVLHKDDYFYLYNFKHGLLPGIYDKIKFKGENAFFCYQKSSNYIDIYYLNIFLISYNLDVLDIENIINENLFIAKSNFNEKYCLLDKTGYRTPFIYDKIYIDDACKIIKAFKSVSQKQVVDIISFDGYYILQDKNNNEIELKKIPFLDILQIKENTHIALWNYNKGLIVPYNKYTKIIPNKYTNQDYIEVLLEDKLGLINEDGKEIVPCIYDFVEKYQDAFFIAKNKNKRPVFYTKNGNILNYSFIDTPEYNLVLVSKTYVPNKYKTKSRYYYQDFEYTTKDFGIINTNGVVIFECENRYNDIRIIDKNKIQIKNVLYTISNESKIENKIILGDGITFNKSCISKTKDYIQINAIKNGYAAACNNERKWGYLDILGNIVVPFIYDFVFGMRKDGTSVVKINNKYGIINTTGATILPVEYNFHGYNNSAVEPIFEKGLTLVERNKQFGFLDINYKEVIPCKYPGFLDFCFSHQLELHKLGYLIVVNKHNKIGIIKLDYPDEYFIDCIYYKDSLSIHKNTFNTTTYISMSTNNECVIIDCTNKTNKLKFSGYIVETIIKDYIILKSTNIYKSTYYAYSITNNKFISSFNYDDVGFICDKYDFLQVKKNNSWGLFNLFLEQEIIPCSYYTNFSKNHLSIYFNFNNGFAHIEKDNKYGLIDQNGNIILECKYENVKSFTNGYVAIYENFQWKIIDNFKHIIIDNLDDCLDFSDGLAAIKRCGKWGYINTNGKIIIPCKFTEVTPFSDGLAAVSFKVKWGYIDKNNQTIIPFRFTFANPFINGTAYVGEYGQYGNISKKGNYINCIESKKDYINSSDYNYDTWDAMTDGMYGDMPDGFNGDYDFLGQ